MEKFFELNPWVYPTAAVIAVSVFVLGLLALLALLFGAWLFKTAVGAKKMLGAVAAIVAVPGKSGKAKFAIGLLFANLLSKASGRVKSVASKIRRKPKVP
jgi:hydrogenase/urease accessory protein HupE